MPSPALTSIRVRGPTADASVVTVPPTPCRRRAAVPRLPLVRLVPLLLAVTVLGGCATASPGDVGTSARPQPDGRRSAPALQDAPVVFEPCGRTPATPDRSNLRGRDLTGADALVDPDRYGRIPVDGPLVAEDVGDLRLTDGVLGAGAGYTGMVGAGESTPVAPGTVDAPVSLLVLDSAASGRRVAFVEVRVADGVPVAWADSEELGVVTDGGDAAVFAPVGAPDPTYWDVDPVIQESIAAQFDESDGGSGVCALRRPAPGGPVDAVLTAIGWGDGWYPVVVGTDADGDVVCVVVDGLITPWAWSGLPGTPPPDA